jgi:molybdate transport system substrate-binding protein
VRKLGGTALAAGLAVIAIAGCSSSSSSAVKSGAGAATGAAQGVKGSITVFAAASLQGAFSTIGKMFMAAHPGTTVKFSFGPSSGLADQIKSGSPADVFASASPQNMATVQKSGDVSTPVTFAKNKMEVAVPPGNPAHVTSVKMLSKSSVKTALCQPQVPCGFTAKKIFGKAGINVKPVTLQPDVKSVLTQVELDNVDAGMVYVTDVMAAGKKVKGIAIPNSQNASTAYPIATVKDSKNLPTAKAFTSYVNSSAGLKVLAKDGFEKP